MRLPDDKHKRNAADRFRTILSADKEPEAAPEPKKPAVVNLPRLGTAGQSPTVSYPAEGDQGRASPAAQGGGFFPVFWTVASLISLAANAFLLITLFKVQGELRAANSTGPSGELLAAVYARFEQMDQAHIKTSIPVSSALPIDVMIPFQTTTAIKLAEDTVVEGAHVQIQSEQFNIDAPATVTLPAGTSLNVALDVQLPLQTIVPIAIEVPVDIPVQDTELHPAILGLQQTIKPLLCEVSPQALLVSGDPICH